jgi:glycosyltransferase involved in cell wall biosynthesis
LTRTLIGLDGRGLGNINRTRGIGQYTRQMLKGLLEKNRDYGLVIFGYGQAGENLDADMAAEVAWREIATPPRTSTLTLPLEHLLLARAVRGTGLSLFHAIDHNLSPWLPVPTLVTVHDLILEVLRGPYLGPTAWLWMRSHRAAARRARRVIAVSESTRRDVERVWGIPGERIAVIPEGVEKRFGPPADREETRASLARLGIERPYFLYVGGFDPRKNLHNLLLGFKRALRGGAGDVQLVLAGDTSGFDDYLQDEILELGLEGRAILPGYVAAGDLPLLYGGALAFTFLSLYEGFGLPLLEAMACGTPVLAAGNSSVPEVVGEAALLTDPLDPSAIAGCLLRLASDEALRRDLAARGIEQAARFTWEGTARRVLDLYGQTLGEGGGGY